jgi:hypothetical protein
LVIEVKGNASAIGPMDRIRLQVFGDEEIDEEAFGDPLLKLPVRFHIPYVDGLDGRCPVAIVKAYYQDEIAASTVEEESLCEDSGVETIVIVPGY